jgi:hypothetical protein
MGGGRFKEKFDFLLYCIQNEKTFENRKTA